MRSPTEQLLEVPDADAAEQSRELRPADVADTPAADGPRVTRPAEADEFDTVEQNLVVDQDDEEEYR
ncbi:hypothetical protein [Parafrankia sp. EUN1f]|uniref:hypothetical protein n=1 Tax=Parafrankia sp. EUN1f TaxID=102897 RepID=UPI0001C45F84|nr:hypothetical protein [Parafrankia sp. EUN1f]EFC81519.1 hypothetical protein FrEUN1fDRAFT_5348 [Parafrankia sp. EUN1f]